MSKQSNILNLICISNDKDDDTIEFIKNLLSEFENEDINFEKLLVETNYSTYKDLENEGINIKDCVLIFGGHGRYDSLWANKKIFYDETIFESGPRTLFAFSCYSGRELRKIFEKCRENSFLGFDSVIAFDKDPGFIEWMKIVFFPAISELFHNSNVVEVHKKTKAKLEDALDFYFEDSSAGSTFLIEMCLVGMLKSLRFA